MYYIVHRILQARILEWVVVPFYRDWTQFSHTAGGFFVSWATKEALKICIHSFNKHSSYKSFLGGSDDRVSGWNAGETWFRFLGQKDPLETRMATVFLLGKSHGQRAWRATVHAQLQFLLFEKNFPLPCSFFSELILHYKSIKQRFLCAYYGQRLYPVLWGI